MARINLLLRSLVLCAVLGTGMAGCQSEIGNGSLPSHLYWDQAQYFAPGPEFQLSPEAAAIKADYEDVDDASTSPRVSSASQ